MKNIEFNYVQASIILIRFMIPIASSIVGLGLAKLIVNQSHHIVISYCNKLSINNFIFVL
jgi:hypothetical protein